MHQFKAVQFLPIDKKEAWDFFSSPTNLTLMTPPEMDFKILTSLSSGEIFDGMKIDYRVKPLFGISMHWQTEIKKVENQRSFTDTQIKGPYEIWEHTHIFSESNDGVLMQDVVNYKLPLGYIGVMMNSILIRKKIENIFEYRKKVLQKLFN